LKLPNLDKNAFLSIYIKNSDIYADLSYTDYNSGRNYILSDVTKLNNDKGLIYSSTFWSEYFGGLRLRFNWEILRGSEIVNMSAEGFGLSAISLYISGRKLETDKLITSIREISYDINIFKVTDEYINKMLDGISHKVGYEDIIYLNLDLLNFDIYRYTHAINANLLNMPLNSNSSFTHSSIDWEKSEHLIDNVKNSKLRAFFSTQANEDKITNTWANFTNSQFSELGNPLMQDIIRSYITIQLLTLLNENGKKYENIGSQRNSTLIVVTGNLIPVLGMNKLKIALLDGLELRGDIDIIFDTNSSFIRRAKSVVEGIENTEFIVSVNDIINNVSKIVISEGNNSGNRKVIFTGKHESALIGEKDVYAFSNEITTIPLNNNKEILTGRFVQGSFWGEKFQTFEIFSDPKTVSYKELIIDGRSKPVIYGPDSRSNLYKLNAWINENN
jgi:hypothetical protein